MQDEPDLLQIKINNAKKQLSEETLTAIDAVPWQAEILKMRETKGYSFEQLGDLETETELLLCGLLSPTDYPKEIETRMQISKAAANDLVQEMNQLVFAKIKEEMIKNTEREKLFGGKEEMPQEFKKEELKTNGAEKEKQKNNQVLTDAGIEIIGEEKKEKGQQLPIPEKLEITTSEKPKKEVFDILARKLSSSVQSGTVKTEHTLENITKTVPAVAIDTKQKIPKVDPYREIPE